MPVNFQNLERNMDIQVQDSGGEGSSLAKEDWVNIFKVIKGKNKLISKNTSQSFPNGKGEKPFTDQIKPRALISKISLQKMLKGCEQTQVGILMILLTLETEDGRL